MKTMKKAGEIIRVSDSDARRLEKSGWAYCPKAEFKALKQPKK